MTIQTDAERAEIRKELTELRKIAGKEEATAVINGALVKFRGWALRGDPAYTIRDIMVNTVEEAITAIRRHK